MELSREASENTTKQFLSPNFCPGMVAFIVSPALQRLEQEGPKYIMY